MQISSATNTVIAAQSHRSGNLVPNFDAGEQINSNKRSDIRELASSIDPKNMSRQESMNLSNALLKAGEGDLSTAFLPPPLLQIQPDGSFKNLTGTAEGNAKMNEKFDMFESLRDRIAYNKENNLPTKILDDGLAFLEKLQIARATPTIDAYT